MVAENLRVDRWDHPVVVAASDEHRLPYAREPVQLGEIRDSPFDDRVVLSTRDLGAAWRVAAFAASEHPLDVFATQSPTGYRDVEEDVQHVVETGLRTVRGLLDVGNPAMHLSATPSRSG